MSKCEWCHGDPCTCPHGWPETENKTVQISEADLGRVFGHKCDQPNCPVCHPEMSLTEWAELYERAATPNRGENEIRAIVGVCREDNRADVDEAYGAGTYERLFPEEDRSCETELGEG